MADLTDLTEPQERMLWDVHHDGERVYNGRARRTIKRLEALGFVEVHWDMTPQAKGNGMELVERITVKLTEECRAGLDRMTDVPEARGF